MEKEKLDRMGQVVLGVSSTLAGILAAVGFLYLVVWLVVSIVQ